MDFLQEHDLFETYFDLCGAAMNLTTYSKENHPTNTASATSKKYSSSEMVFKHLNWAKGRWEFSFL